MREKPTGDQQKARPGPKRLGILCRDGSLSYRTLEKREDEAAVLPGKVLFPFKQTNVHSDKWKASEHTRFISKK